jgi:hypothetical protein
MEDAHSISVQIFQAMRERGRPENRWKYFFSFGATAPIRALAYLHETFRFTSIYLIADSR